MVSGKTRRARFGACIVVSSLVGAAGGGTSVNAQESTELAPIVLQGSDAAEGDGQGGGLKAKGYVAQETSVATKTDTDIRRVPQSIGTVSRKELEDRNVQSLVEAARYTAGVRAGQFGFDPRFDTIFMRGFNVTDTGFYRDGLRSLGGRFSVFRHEPYTLQGVTLLKGPSSGVYGSGAPGGIVNVISKRPTEAPFNEIEAQTGSYGRAQVNFDTSGPVGGNDNILYRLTGMKRSADTQFMAARDDRFSIAPALTLRTEDRDTQLTLLGEYTDFTSGGATGWFTRPPGVITDLEQGDPRYRDYKGRQYRIGYEFEHRLSDDLVFKQNLRYQNIHADMKYVGIPLVLGDIVLRAPEHHLDDASGIAVDNQLLWSFETGPLEHKLMTGFDYTYVDHRWRYGRGGFMFDADAPIIPPTALDLYDLRTNQQQVGLYVQDQINGAGITVLGVAGALGGGYLVRHYGAYQVMFWTLPAQAVAMFSLASIAYWDVQSLPLLLLTLLLSALMFALGFVALYSELMGRASLDQAGVDFTIFQSADAIISLIGWQLAAVAGESLGYAFCFASASVFGLITLKLLPRLRQ